MRIVADPKIACVERAFAGLGELVLVPGRGFTPSLIRGAEILLVRSVTRVDAALLAGSAVRFVGTATSGVDHVDLDYLQSHGIGFAAAPGSNAQAVAEYVLSAVLVLAESRGTSLRKAVAGIIGHGRVGSRVARLLERLGITCVPNDPPLEVLTGDPRLRSLDEALDSDIVTLHVPLTRDGPHPTHHLIDARRLAQVKPGAILINTARGGVVDESALLRALQQGRRMSAVLDCWENEPAIDADLLERVALGTPHIAGHSFDAKLRATAMLYRSVCEWLGIGEEWRVDRAVAPCPELRPDARLGDEAFVRQAMRCCYDIREDDRSLRRLLARPTLERPQYFDRVRDTYRQRREFNACRLAVPANRQVLIPELRALGFEII